MTDPAQAFLNHGNVDQWTRGAPTPIELLVTRA